MRTLALIEAPDHVCARYRLLPFVRGVAASGGVLEVEPLERSPLRRVVQLRRADRYDCVVLQRKLLPGWQLGILRKAARRLLFDFDDAVVYRDSNDPRGPECPRRAARFARLMGEVDGVFAGNRFLADLAEVFGAARSKVHVIPTCVDTSAYLLPAFKPTPNEPGVRLVWIGSSGTLSGLERQRPVWERLGREVPGARLKVICDRFPRFDPLPVDAVDWSAATETAELAASDAGISWIPDDLWSRGKCGLKVLQFMAAGLAVVANPVGVHAEMIQPGRTGELAETADEWVEAVRKLAIHPARRAEMGREARRVVEARYSVEAWTPQFVAALSGRHDLRAHASAMPEVARSA